LYDPTYGVVFVDGEVWPSGLKGFGESVGYMRQTSQILDGTIRYNLTLDAEYTEEQIAEAIAMARFDTVVQRLPKGLESRVFEQGVNLSGGECQRLALARSILASLVRREIILLDEPTSSLDPVTEKFVLDGIMKRFRKELIICSTHRFDILPQFDRIIVMKNGEIIDCGTYDELMERCPEFVRLKSAKVE
jgi:ABC-type multidrug transport system fused ATPase/permease subunit